MNEWSRFVQAQLDARGWRAAELARRSGVAPQVISLILNDTREQLARPPHPATVAGFARAFGGADMERRLWLRVAAAMGLPVGEEVVVADASRLSNDQLVAEISRRLDADAEASGANPEAGPDVDSPEPVRSISRGQPASREVARAAQNRPRSGNPRKPSAGRRPHGETGQT